MTIATVIAFAYVGYDETTSRADAPPAAVQPTGATSIALVSAGAGR
jgi:hypothetical protein